MPPLTKARPGHTAAQCHRSAFNRIKYLSEPLLAFALTISAILLGFYISGIYPFGTLSALRGDAIYQYAGFFGWLHNVFNGNASIAYSAAKGLGGPTIGLFSYYLASPLNIVMALADPEDAPKVMTLLIVLKLGLMSSSSALFLKKRFELRGAGNILLASTYGLSASNFVSGANLMWLDGMIMLPIVCLAVYQLKRKGTISPLAFSIGFTIIANWYSAYMVCIFSALWLMIELVTDQKTSVFSIKTFHCLFIYCIAMLLGACISAVLFIPTILDLLKTGSAPTTNSTQFPALISSLSPTDILAKNYMGDMSIYPDSTGLTGGLFTSSLLVVGFISFLQSRCSFRMKVGLSILLGFLVLSELSPALSLLWTGFSKTDSFNPRFHFTLVFTLMSCSAIFLKYGARLRFAPLFSGLIYTLCITALVLQNAYSNTEIALAQAAMAIATSIALRLFCCPISLHTTSAFTSHNHWSQIRATSALVVGTTMVVEICFCIAQAYNLNSSEQRLLVDDFHSYYSSIDDLSHILSSEEAEPVNRSEHLGISYLGKSSTTFPTGESLALGIKGVNHYSSTGSQASKELLGSLGYNGITGTRGITYYNSPLALPDTLLGIEGVYSSEDVISPYGTQSVSTAQSNYGNVVLHRYPKTAELGFIMPNERYEIDLNNIDPFENQSSMSYALTGIGNTYSNVSAILHGDPHGDSRVEYELPITASGPVYIYINSSKTLSLTCNDRILQNVNDWEFSSNIIYLGTYAPGDIVKLTLSSFDGSAIGEATLTARQLSPEKYNAVTHALDKVCANTTQWDDDNIQIEANSNGNSSLVLTIPFDQSWAAQVNGANIVPTNWNGFLLIPLQDGQNDVDLTYHIRGIKEGAIITLLGCSFVLTWDAMAHYRASRKKNGSA